MDAMQKFRKRPVVVEAVQWDGTVAKATEVIDWVLANGGIARYADWVYGELLSNGTSDIDAGPFVLIGSLEGVMRASAGDYVIRGVQGEFYPCKADIFQQTYEETSNA